MILVTSWSFGGNAAVDPGAHERRVPERGGVGAAAAAAGRAAVAAAAGQLSGIDGSGLVAARDQEGEQQRHASQPTQAPAAVASPFTPSFDSHRIPPKCCVCTPQRWRVHSLGTSHAGQWNRPCAAAPSHESSSMPPKPMPVPAARSGTPPAGRLAAAVTQAPASAPTVPRTRHTPAGPGGYGAADQQVPGQRAAAGTPGGGPGVGRGRGEGARHHPERGRRAGEQRGARRGRPAVGQHLPRVAALALRVERRRPPAGREPGHGAREAKNASSTAPPGQPAPTRIAAPTSHAATAPAPSRARGAEPRRRHQRRDRERDAEGRG